MEISRASIFKVIIIFVLNILLFGKINKETNWSFQNFFISFILDEYWKINIKKNNSLLISNHFFFEYACIKIKWK